MTDPLDLFGKLADPEAPALSDAERKRLYRRAASVPRGHAWKPGTGPEGETCKTCAHYTLRQFGGTYRKCGLMRAHWTSGPKTDVRASDPACLKWSSDEASS